MQHGSKGRSAGSTEGGVHAGLCTLRPRTSHKSTNYGYSTCLTSSIWVIHKSIIFGDVNIHRAQRAMHRFVTLA
eukprot:5218249-Amphidinium_carterae.2